MTPFCAPKVLILDSFSSYDSFVVTVVHFPVFSTNYD